VVSINQELTSFFHAGGDGISPEKMNSDEYKVSVCLCVCVSVVCVSVVCVVCDKCIIYC